MSAALTAEWSTANARRTAGSDRRLLTAGVPSGAIWRGPELVGRARIITDRGGTFQPHDDGVDHYVTPVAESYDWAADAFEIVDSAAWRPETPERMYLRRGVLPILQSEEIERARMSGESLLLHSSILAWLRHDRQGAVVLPVPCDLALWLGSVPRIVATDRRLAARLDRELNRQPRRVPVRFLEVQNAA